MYQLYDYDDDDDDNDNSIKYFICIPLFRKNDQKRR